MCFVHLGVGFAGVLLFYLLRQDWLPLVGQRRRMRGAVHDHRHSVDEGADSVAPMIRFMAGAGEAIEYVDIVHSSSRRPPVGVMVEVIYPEGGAF